MTKVDTTYPNLGKAPIILCILQMKFVLRESVDKSFSSRILERVKVKYPKFEQTKSAQVQINPNDKNTPISLKMLAGDGFNYAAIDNKSNFAISNSAFTFQTGSPYSTWENFFSEAWWAWKHCELEQKIESVNWLSIRYINSFEVEGNSQNIFEPSDYFRSYPKLPGEHPDYTRFLIQYTLPIEPPYINIKVGIESRETVVNIFPLMFDVDAIWQSKIKYEEEALVNVFAKLRDYKNSVFFNNLTEKTIELFK